MFNRDEILFLVHNQNIWPEELLGDEFQHIISKSFSIRERQILEHKVQGFSDKFIQKLFKIKPKRYRSSLIEIKQKLRMGDHVRIDNWVRKTRRLYTR